MISDFMMQFYSSDMEKPKEIYISDEYYSSELEEFLGVDILTPQKGVKKEILEMAYKNAKEALETKRHIYENKVVKSMNTIEKLGEILGISTPYTIEAFDNSNIFGEYPVSGMVVYKNGRPSKKDYRKYHVKTVVGANDFATMQEIVKRRYERLRDEGKKNPDLIVMDGGEIQVNACKEALKEINIDINVMGIKKDDNHKANVIIFNDKEISIDKTSDVYLLLASISQNVHDFAISFFRSTKGKGMFSSRLDGIKGLGPKGKEKLIKHFVTIDNIKESSIDDIEALGFKEEMAIKILKHLLGEDDV